MSLIDIKELLKSKFESEKLGHFYIIEPGRVDKKSSQIYSWTNELIANFLAVESILNHEDYLEVTPSKEQGLYTLEDFKPFFNFLSFKASKSSRKFIVIKNADKLSVLIANKLLKTLEEPPIKCTIFLINENKNSLLETIVSRGIKLTVPSNTKFINNDSIKDEHKWSTLLSLKDLPVHQIIEKLKNSNNEQEAVLLQLLDLCKESNVAYQQIIKIQKLINEFQQDKLYHNASTHRLFALANILKDLKPIYFKSNI